MKSAEALNSIVRLLRDDRFKEVDVILQSVETGRGDHTAVLLSLMAVTKNVATFLPSRNEYIGRIAPIVAERLGKVGAATEIERRR